MKRPQQKRGNQRRKPQPRPPASVDIWRTPGPLPELEPVVVSHEVSALIRSLGEPPLHGSVPAADYFEKVVERSAAIAAALALSADLLAD
jgi:hypothetical protein